MITQFGQLLEFCIRTSHSHDQNIHHGKTLYFLDGLKKVVPKAYLFPMILVLLPIGAILLFKYYLQGAIE